ncbi:hypothetical protein CTI12_AA138320 [Artemisia annua]|uniref:DUF7054 domain-containing protein n=1 Tax=Artemisia annua TaxID=35608 RepID=A0A2U1PLZ3_ARTAN|nr:hypothetical protein CTI12_AA138320 [Artemisia annua]
MCLTERPLSNTLLRYAKSCFSVNPSSKAQRDNQLPNSFTCINAASSDGEIFDGFQKIQALETDLLITDLATPNFGTYVEKMMKVETDTEDELKLVKEKLKKVLLTCSGKSRHVSATRGGSKILEEAANNEHEAIIDPLQHEVFCSEVGGPKTTIMKERRESLWELFQKTNRTEEKAKSISKCKRECWIKSDAECKPDTGTVEGKQCGMMHAHVANETKKVHLLVDGELVRIIRGVVGNVMDTALRAYALEHTLPVLGSNINDFVLYCPIAGTEALNPLEAIGSFGVRNFMLCKRPQVMEDVGNGKPVTV